MWSYNWRWIGLLKLGTLENKAVKVREKVSRSPRRGESNDSRANALSRVIISLTGTPEHPGQGHGGTDRLTRAGPAFIMWHECSLIYTHQFSPIKLHGQDRHRRPAAAEAVGHLFRAKQWAKSPHLAFVCCAALAYLPHYHLHAICAIRTPTSPTHPHTMLLRTTHSQITTHAHKAGITCLAKALTQIRATDLARCRPRAWRLGCYTAYDRTLRTTSV